ncbi:MAG: hypothetical protein ACI4JF_07145, partial [Oscillospiraceae bacterium]
LFFIVDFILYRKKRITLQMLAVEITYTVDNLPVPVGTEEDYDVLVRTLYDSMKTAVHICLIC